MATFPEQYDDGFASVPEVVSKKLAPEDRPARHNYLVSRKEPLITLVRGALLRPRVVTELYAAQVDRVAAGKLEYYATKALRWGMEAALRDRAATIRLAEGEELTEGLSVLIQKNAPAPAETWRDYDAEAMALEKQQRVYWDEILANVSGGACTPSELQLVLDTVHPDRSEFAVVQPFHPRLKHYAPQLYELPPLSVMPQQRAVRKVERAIVAYAKEAYPNNPRTSNAHYARVIAEAKLRQARGLIEPDNLTNPHDIARDERLLATVQFLSDSQLKRYPKEVSRTLRQAMHRRHERAALREQQGLLVPQVGKALLKAVFVRPPEK